MVKTKKFIELEYKLKRLELRCIDINADTFSSFLKKETILYEKIETLIKKLNKLEKDNEILIKYINFKQIDIKKVLTNKKIYKDFMEETINVNNILCCSLNDCLKEYNLNIYQITQILSKFDKYKNKQEEYDKYKETSKQEKTVKEK